MAFSFGTNTAVSSAPSAFGGFGATSSAPPAFGSFNTPASTATSGFGFGASNTSFGGAPTASSSGGFGTTGFGGAAAASSGGFGGFGTNTQTSSAFGGFGQTTATSSAGGGLFGGGNTNLNRPTGLNFGTNTSSAFGGGGGGFGGASNTGGIFSSTSTAAPFGGGSSFGGGFTQPQAQPFQQQFQQQQQQQQQQQPNVVQQLYNSVLHCSVFGDERDSILAKWNMMQASWGAGKAFYSSTQPALPLTPENEFCRFKTIGYSAKPKGRYEDGLLSGVIKKKLSEVAPLKDQIASGIQNIMGNRPNVLVKVEDISSAAGSDCTEVIFSVQETNPQNGQTRKFPSNEVQNHLTQPMQVQNLQKLGLESVTAKVAFSEKQIRGYLDNAPQGIDPRLWKQAQLDNPDPKTLIPVPMIGFKALQQRIQCQNQQAKTYIARLNAISDEMASIQKRHQDTKAKLRDAKRRQLALGHRVLHVMVKQEETRKIGFTIQPEEEKLRIQLEALQAEISAPTQFKGRLNELLAKVRLQSQASVLSSSGGSSEKQSLDPFLMMDIKHVLKQQQEGIQVLVKMMKEDLNDLNVITEVEEKEAGLSKKKTLSPYRY